MSEEIVIIPVKPKMCEFYDEPEPDTWSYRCNYEKELYEVNQPITHRPTFLAIRDTDICYVELFYRINQAKSKFQKGQIVPEGKPKKVSIPLRVKDKSQARNTVWYASFETLLTHNSTDEFTEEKSSNFTCEKLEDQRVLCNGSSCNHFTYCTFFNHSQSPTVKTSELNLEAEYWT